MFFQALFFGWLFGKDKCIFMKVCFEYINPGVSGDNDLFPLTAGLYPVHEVLSAGKGHQGSQNSVQEG